MRHRIIVLGAGYAGAASAGHLARRLHPEDVEITVVSAEPDFVERMRLHQLAAGRELRRFPLARMFAGTGIRLRVARVTALDPERRTVTVTDGQGTGQLEYDTLLYTLGSTSADHGVPGVGEHAFNVADRPSAQRLRERLDELGDHGTVTVVGGNLTGIEAATEIAESRPGLRLTLATSGEVGGWLGIKARRHMLRAFDRLGIALSQQTTVERVDQTGVHTSDGAVLPADATVWAAGFTTHPIAAASGLKVEENGQITVDRMMRSVSHPGVYAAGDSAHAIGDNGRPLPMSCASANLTRTQVSATIVGDLTGRKVPRAPLFYPGNCVSLGSRDALFQVVDGEAKSKTWAVRGWTATRVKAAVLSTVAWNTGNPTYKLPSRRRRLSAEALRALKAVAD